MRFSFFQLYKLKVEVTLPNYKFAKNSYAVILKIRIYSKHMRLQDIDANFYTTS